MGNKRILVLLIVLILTGCGANGSDVITDIPAETASISEAIDESSVEVNVEIDESLSKDENDVKTSDSEKKTTKDSTEAASKQETAELEKTGDNFEYQIGNTVLFGTYEQDNDTSNGKEPISWIVIDEEDGNVLLLTEKILDAATNWNDEDVDLNSFNWIDSSLRQYLISNFYNEAFNEDEKNRICPMHIVVGDKEVTDDISLLSESDYENYLQKSDYKTAKITRYSYNLGMAVTNSEQTGEYWLRTISKAEENEIYKSAVTVAADGKLSSERIVNNGYKVFGIRPVICLSTNDQDRHVVEYKFNEQENYVKPSEYVVERDSLEIGETVCFGRHVVSMDNYGRSHEYRDLHWTVVSSEDGKYMLIGGEDIEDYEIEGLSSYEEMQEKVDGVLFYDIFDDMEKSLIVASKDEEGHKGELILLTNETANRYLSPIQNKNFEGNNTLAVWVKLK